MEDFCVHEPYFINEAGQLEARQLNGVEKLKVLSQMGFFYMKLIDFENVKDISLISKLWCDFYALFVSISDNIYYGNMSKKNVKDSIEIETFNWLILYEKIYSGPKITPYMHIFGEHMAELYEEHGPIGEFSMQGLEKLNDLSTKWYFNSTNKKSDFTEQMIKKINIINLANMVKDYSWENYENDLNIGLLTEGFRVDDLYKG